MKNKSNLIEDSSSQIWSLCEKRSELVKAFDPVNFFIKPPRDYMGLEYFDDVVWKMKDLTPDFRKLDDEFDCLMMKLKKHDIGYEEIQDLLSVEYWTWVEGFISDVVELFLSLPAEHVCKKLLSKSFNQENPISDLHSALCGYDRAPLNGISLNDRRIQAWRSWHKINILKRIGNFELVDPIDKRRVRKGEYKNGEMHGNVKEYINGKLTSIIAYERGEQTGRYQHFRSNGTLSEEGISQKGSEISKYKILFDDKGMPLNGIQEDFMYGKGNFLNGKRHGEFIGKNQKGEIISVTSFIMGKKDGLHWQNNDSAVFGIKHKELYYKNDVLDGPYKYFHDNGQISEQGSYKDGHKNGIVLRFDMSGKLINKAKYF